MSWKKGRKKDYGWGWYDRPVKKPIPEGSGIRGGGKYGVTWWGQQWLNAFNRISDSNRLPRGRTYANNGSVQQIQIPGSRILAKVQGTRLYQIEIQVPVFTSMEKERIRGLIQQAPVVLSKLLNRELPSELHDLCLKEGIHLFPENWSAFKASCSCPDWAMPCKHLAAVIYLVANEIDKNPFLVFDLHDFNLAEAFGMEGDLSETQTHGIPALRELRQPLDDAAPPDFEFDPALLEAIDFSAIPPCRDNLMAILAEKPVFYPPGNFRETLNKAMTSIAKKAQAESPPESSVDDAREQTYRLAEIVEMRLNAHGAPIDFSAWDDEQRLLFTTSNLEDWEAWLAGIPAGSLAELPDDLRAHWLAWRFAAVLARQGAMTPQVLHAGGTDYLVRWIPALLNEEVAATYRRLAALLPSYILNIETPDGLFLPEEGGLGKALLSVYLNRYVRQFHGLNENAMEHPVPKVFFSGQPVAFSKFEHREYPASIALWLDRFYLSTKDRVPVLEVHESSEGFEVSLAIEDKTKPLEVPIPLNALFAQNKYDSIRLEILRDLSMLSGYFPGLNRLLADKGEAPLRFSAKDFADVLFHTLPVIRLFGIRVLLPKSLSRILKPQLGIRLSSGKKPQPAAGLSLGQMLSYQWQVAIGDQDLTAEEFLQLLKTSKGLVKLRDEYVFFDENETRKLAEKLAKPAALNGHQLLQAALAETHDGVRVQLTDELREQIRQLLTVDLLPLPKGLQAELRPYQHRGFSWLCKNAQIGFGSILADDMGLGKTLQVIAALQHFKESGTLQPKRPALAIVPTTLLTNWARETARFAPELRTAIYHGPGRSLDDARQADLILTSYGVARSDLSRLEKLPWHAVVIDEAQNIKNPAAEQTKAVKKIPAPIRIALSGTPVENRLSEYWSVFDFTNKGYLGSLKTFAQEYAQPIENNRDQPTLRRFQKATQPFVMRRLKSDKSIISDLPDKVEQDQFCALSPEQAALYQGVVDQTLQKIASSEGIERKGLVLSLIMMLKQICNHPAQYLKKGPAKPELSGKCPLLLDLLGQALANNEKTLIFTQFRQMGNLLIPLLEDGLGLKPEFLHGGVSRKERDAMVTRFQTSRAHPILLLSLKAGGTGLNLTAASQVIHYDLWWNPAVEAQATDRAYRIGQQRNVQVHRFITANTFEERIDAMIRSKKELANLTVSSGETWIGDLSDNELRNLFQLG